MTSENDSHNFLHFSNLALLHYIKLFQDRLSLNFYNLPSTPSNPTL
jgi:hypothetical protein